MADKEFDWQAHLDEFRDHIIEDLWPLVKPMDWFKLNPVNSLMHNNLDVDQTAESLKQFKQRSPLVYNENNSQLTAGNGRYMAAEKLGWKYLAFVGENDDLETAIRYGLADNLTGRRAEWDLVNARKLVEELGEADALLVPGMTNAIFDQWKELDPLGEDGSELPEDWQEFDEEIETEHECPKCGYNFTDNK